MLQAQPADRRLVEAGQAVEHRGLAGTVGADDGGDLAVPGGEADVIDRDQAAEPHGQVLDREQRANAHSAASPAGALRPGGDPCPDGGAWSASSTDGSRSDSSTEERHVVKECVSTCRSWWLP